MQSIYKRRWWALNASRIYPWNHCSSWVIKPCDTAWPIAVTEVLYLHQILKDIDIALLKIEWKHGHDTDMCILMKTHCIMIYWITMKSCVHNEATHNPSGKREAVYMKRIKATQLACKCVSWRHRTSKFSLVASWSAENPESTAACSPLTFQDRIFIELASLLSGGGLIVLGLYANHPGFFSLWERRVQGSLLRVWYPRWEPALLMFSAMRLIPGIRQSRLQKQEFRS